MSSSILRKLTIIVATAAALAAQTAPKKTPTPSIDKAKLEAYIRHLFVWPPPIEVVVGDPEPGPMPGFYSVKIRGSQGEARQEETFYVSTDGKTIVRGSFFDIDKNPFKEDLARLTTEYQPSIGTPGAPVVLVEFSDFECPYCRQQAKMLHEELLKAYPKEVRLYYLDFPLESLHPWAKSAAMAGRCIFHQNASAFWDYHDWIFDNQDQIMQENLKDKILEFAKGKGVDGPQLSKCMETGATEQEVNKTRTEGKDLDINSTPTLFVNGRRMVGSIQWSDLKRVIDYEIDYQKTAKNAGEDCGCSVQLAIPGVAPANNSVGLKK
ncbi:MAG TPA: thioredoxin domain-containing protein [Bryobacteraceae bacterium]|nr:thioredoxin domain-containing protein [Bryobacteraceae bacterium]